MWTKEILMQNIRLVNVGVETSACWDQIRREEKRTLVTEKSRSDSFADTITEQSLERQIDCNVVSACDFFGLCSNVLQIVAAD